MVTPLFPLTWVKVPQAVNVRVNRTLNGVADCTSALVFGVEGLVVDSRVRCRWLCHLITFQHLVPLSFAVELSKLVGRELGKDFVNTCWGIVRNVISRHQAQKKFVGVSCLLLILLLLCLQEQIFERLIIALRLRTRWSRNPVLGRTYLVLFYYTLFLALSSLFHLRNFTCFD